MKKKQEEAIEDFKREFEQCSYTKSDLIIELDCAKEILNMLKEKDAKIEHLEEKRNNQKQELAILNEKQKEMNKLINTVSSYKGMFKQQQKEMKKKDKQIDLMAEFISNQDIDEDICKEQVPLGCDDINREVECKDCIKQYFENKAKE